MTLVSFSSNDEALQEEDKLYRSMAIDGSPKYLFWVGHKGLVAPRSLSRLPGFDEAAKQSAARGWRVSLRSSGGDVVPQGRGTLNFCMVACEHRNVSIAEGYQLVCRPIQAVIGGECASVEASFCDGSFNIVVDGRKVAGTAQRRRRIQGRTVILAHAMILVDEDIGAGVSAVSDFLAMIGRNDQLLPSAHVNAAQAAAFNGLTPQLLASRIAAEISLGQVGRAEIHA